MNPERLELLALPSPFLTEAGVLRLMEAAGSPQEEFYARIVRGTYDKPYILEDSELRQLCFGMGDTKRHAHLRSVCSRSRLYARNDGIFAI